MKEKVSFDFDFTLSRKDVQIFAKELVKEGHEVWIVTSRYSNERAKEFNDLRWLRVFEWNKDLFKIADECGIKKEHIKFTNMESKSVFLKNKGFVFHLDDDDIELMEIDENLDGCTSIFVEDLDWKEKCKKVLSK